MSRNRNLLRSIFFSGLAALSACATTGVVGRSPMGRTQESVVAPSANEPTPYPPKKPKAPEGQQESQNPPAPSPQKGYLPLGEEEGDTVDEEEIKARCFNTGDCDDCYESDLCDNA